MYCLFCAGRLGYHGRSWKQRWGLVEKCTFCSHRLLKARDRAAAEKREMRADEYVPACVEACPSKAMYFGDLKDPDSVVSVLARSPRAFHFLEDLGRELADLFAYILSAQSK